MRAIVPISKSAIRYNGSSVGNKNSETKISGRYYLDHHRYLADFAAVLSRYSLVYVSVLLVLQPFCTAPLVTGAMER